MKKEFYLDFCDEYNYPPIIKEIIFSFCAICCQFLENNLVSMLLIGSCARGELTTGYDDKGEPLIYSDLEFIVYVKQKPPQHLIRDIQNAVFELESPYTCKSPFFHIDYGIAPIGALKKRVNRFIIFEAKATGKVIYGADLRPYLPNLNSSNLNYLELNEVLLHRLWSILLYLPKTFLKDNADYVNFNYIISRNVLDITTWLLPYEHKELIPGFKQRLDFLNAHWSKLDYKSFFTQDDLEFMNECYIGKMQLRFSKKTHVLYQNAILLFIKAIKYMLHKHNLPADEKTYQDILLKNSRQLFEGQTVKRKLVDSYMIRKKLKERSLGYLARWVLLDKRALAVLFNLNMHIAILSYIKSIDNDFSALLKAEQCLKSLNPDYKASPADTCFKLLHMRRFYADYLTDYERGYQAKKNYFYKLLEVK